MTRGHAWCAALAHVQVALLLESLDDLVEQLAELAAQLVVFRGVAGTLAAEDLQHLRRQQAGVHQRLKDGFLQPVERAVGVSLADIAPPGMLVGPAGKPRLEQEVGQLVEQRLQIDGVGELRRIAGKRGVAHPTG